MAISHVIKLFSKIDDDYLLRGEICECNGYNELISMFNNKGYFFDMEDIENAINILHVRCKTMDDAIDLFHKAEWLRYLMRNE